MNPIESHIILMLESPLREIGYDLVSVTLRKGKEGSVLYVVVDRVAPISLAEIVEVSNLVSKLLDEDDGIEGAYTLDVSSLGAEKPIALEKLGEYVGRYVNLHLSNPYKGENVLEGTLLAVSEGQVTLQVKQKSRRVDCLFPLGDVDKARLAIEF